MREYLVVFLVAAAVTYLLTVVAREIAIRTGAVAKVRDRDVHAEPIPYLGGLAMLGGLFAAYVVARELPFLGSQGTFVFEDALAVLLAGALVCAVGVIDDIFDLDALTKFGGQVLAVGVLVYSGIQFRWFYQSHDEVFSLDIAQGALLTAFAVVATVNAVNFIDGLDGLVAGVCLIANGVFFAYAYILTRDSGATSYFNLATFLAAVLIGACMGFLPFNWSPAKLFMGDSGALVLGLLMATSAIALTTQGDVNAFDPERFGRSQLLGAFIPIVLPLVIVMLPLLDFGLAVFRRMRAGKSPFAPDRKHLHHRMLDLGHRDRDAVLVFYSWTAVISLAVLLMYIASRQDWPGGYLVGVAFGVLGVAACLIVTLRPPRRRIDTPTTEEPR